MILTIIIIIIIMMMIIFCKPHPEAHHGDLHGIGGGQARQQAPLLRDVLHYHLLPKLWPLAAVPDRNGGAHLTRINSTLSNQQPTCDTATC